MPAQSRMSQDVPESPKATMFDQLPETGRAPKGSAARASAPERRADPGPEISIVVPMHDEVENVEPLLAEIAATLNGTFTYEVVCVDDGSGDGTVEALQAAADANPAVRVLRHSRRCGKSAGVQTGARAARAPIVVLMDGDRQNDPADVPALVADLRDGRSRDPHLIMVAGQRGRRADTWLRQLSSRVANGVRGAVLGDGTRDTGCGLKAITREGLLALPYFDGQHRFMSALVQAQGGRVTLRDVADRPRAAGQAKYGVWNRLWVGIGDLLAVTWLVRRSHLPDRVEDLSADASARGPANGPGADASEAESKRVAGQGRAAS